MKDHDGIIKIRDRGGVPIVKEGFAIPMVVDGCIAYSTTKTLEEFWNSLSSEEQENIVKESIAKKVDFRELLSNYQAKKERKSSKVR